MAAVDSAAGSGNTERKETAMSLSMSTIKNAAMTTAAVLAVIYVVRRTTMGQKLVQAALAG